VKAFYPIGNCGARAPHKKWIFWQFVFMPAIIRKLFELRNRHKKKPLPKRRVDSPLFKKKKVARYCL